MTERTVMRQQLQAGRMSQTIGIVQDDKSDTDSVATASTEVSISLPGQEYPVERILAEKDKLGERHFFIKWADYPIERATWEPESSIIDPTLISAWDAQKRAGAMKPFDLAAWEANKQRLDEESKKRKLKRREKRLRAQRSSTSAERLAKERTTTSERLSREQNTLANIVKNKGTRQAIDSQKDIVEGGRTQLKKLDDQIDAAKKSSGSRKKAKAPTNATVPSKGYISDDSDDQPLLPARLAARGPPKIGKALESNDESSDDDRPASIRASVDNGQATRKTQKSRNLLSKDVPSSDADSLMEELQDKMVEKPKPEPRKSLVIETTRKPLLQEKRSLDAHRRSTDSLLAGSPRLGLVSEVSRQPSRRAYRDSLQEPTSSRSMSTANQGNADATVKRGPGRPRGPGRGGATRGMTGVRKGQLRREDNVFTKSDVPLPAKKNSRYDLNDAVVADPNSVELARSLRDKNLIQHASRSRADGAPNLDVLGGLVNPGEQRHSRTAYSQLNPPSRQPDIQRRTSTGEAVSAANSPPTSRRSSNARVVRFIDDENDRSGHFFEEPSSIGDNSSIRGGGGDARGSPAGQVVTGRGFVRPATPVRMSPKPIIRAPLMTKITTSNGLPGQAPLRRTESITSTTASSYEAPNIDPHAKNQSAFHPTTGPREIATSNMVDTRIVTHENEANTSSRKKVSLDEYRAKRGIEKGPNLVKLATFGGLYGSNQVLVAFDGVARNCQDQWVREIGTLDALSFAHVCAFGDFRVQPLFNNAKVLKCGVIGANAEATRVLDRISEHLRIRLSGLIFSYLSTAILVFPTRTEEWKYLENSEVIKDVQKDAALRYQVFELPEFCSTITAPLNGPPPSQLVPSTSPWSSAVDFLCSFNYESLIPPMEGRSESKQDRDKFFLIMPENATPSPLFLTTWLKNCKPSCKVLSCYKPGSWEVFTSGNYSGTILIHESLLRVIPSLSGVGRLAGSSTRIFAFFQISSCPAPQPGLSLHNRYSHTFVKTRLFPHGGAFLLTPNIYRAEPKLVMTFLNWFSHRRAKDPHGTEVYKLLGCHGLRESLLDIANERALERATIFTQGGDMESEAMRKGCGLNSCYFGYEVVKKIDAILEDADTVLPPYYGLQDVDESENPIIYAPELIDRDDEPKLIDWFAGWALMNLDKYKRFSVIGTDSSNILKAFRKNPSQETSRWKKSGFTAVTEVAPAPLFSTVAPAFQSNLTGDFSSPSAVNPVVQQAPLETGSSDADLNVWELDVLIAEFIALTGGNDPQAIEYLTQTNGDLDAAVRLYREEVSHAATSVNETSDTLGLDNAENINKSRNNSLEGQNAVVSPTNVKNSAKADINAQPKDIPMENLEARKSPNALSMLPRNIRHSSAANAPGKKFIGIDVPNDSIRTDDNGDVIMGDVDNDQAPQGPTSLRLQTQVPPVTFLYSAIDEESGHSRSPSPTKQGFPKSSSSKPSAESTIQWHHGRKKAGKGWGHITVWTIEESFAKLNITKDGKT